ncbi:MAG: DUF1934 domain-containing protein [Clostridia bacterium]|nr:DUF1934 domain-containing protein [Clostridia bacterium]
MEKQIKIKIISKQYELSKILMDKLFSDFEEISEDAEEICAEREDEDTLSLVAEGVISDDGERIEIRYEESELTGMEGATTTLSFERKNPNLVTMLRGGSVTTAMAFEPKKRHICVYETPYMPFELCIHTLALKNELLTCGRLYLDYIVEFKGAQAERTKFTMTLEEKKAAYEPLDEYDDV